MPGEIRRAVRIFLSDRAPHTITEEDRVTSGVIGRDEELAAVRAFVTSVSDGPAGLVIEGEAGIGKTTLWRAGVDAARERSYRVLTATPTAAETALSTSCK